VELPTVTSVHKEVFMELSLKLSTNVSILGADVEGETEGLTLLLWLKLALTDGLALMEGLTLILTEGLTLELPTPLTVLWESFVVTL